MEVPIINMIKYKKKSSKVIWFKKMYSNIKKTRWIEVYFVIIYLDIKINKLKKIKEYWLQ